MVLVDEERIWEELDEECRAIPFFEREGQCWGPPPDDETAIHELERLRREQAPSHLVFAWPVFWWLDHYAGFRRHLEGTFPCVLANERLVAFDLR